MSTSKKFRVFLFSVNIWHGFITNKHDLKFVTSKIYLIRNSTKGQRTKLGNARIIRTMLQFVYTNGSIHLFNKLLMDRVVCVKVQ